MSLSIRLLGPPEVSVEGRCLPFGRKKALALLCYLAAEGGKHHRRELAELLWPKSEERHARTDLRSTLTRLRKTLGENDVSRGDGGGEGVRPLAVDGDFLGVEPRGVDLDLRTLEAAVSLARSETSGSSSGGTSAGDAAGRRDLIAHLKGALGTYRGEFMGGFALEDAAEFELWLEAQRARWCALFGELCERVSRLQAGAGQLEEATETARLWVRHAFLEEEARLRLMDLLSAAGDGEGALLAYDDFRSALGRELEAEPSPRLTALAGRLREEVGARASLGGSLARSAAATPLLSLEVPFAGRRQEFGALVSEYQACLAGEEPRVVAVTGEAGMGKTRLAEEFLGWARARGADVLEGAASEGARLPYGPLVEAVRPRIERERAPDDLLEDAWLSELSRLLPELKERYPDLPLASGEGETAKGALFEAIARTVGALASRAPVVLFLDDLHWTDATTSEVLDYATRRWAEQGGSVLLIVAARPEEIGAGSPLAGWLSYLGRRLPVRNVSIGPLESEDVGGMLRRLAEVGSPAGAPAESEGGPEEARAELERFVEWLAAETGGQPFYLVETLKALLEEGKLVVRDLPDGARVLEVGPALRAPGSDDAPLPQGVREVIRSRLSRLSSAASELVAAGAVLGRRFGFESLMGVAALGEAEVLGGLDELVGRRLLLEETGGRGEGGSPLYPDAAYSFSHEKIRQVTYTEGGQARRRVLHRRAFWVLEGGSTPAAELAHHALAGGLAKEAFAYSVAAGDEAAEVFAARDAVAHYERARELLNSGRRSGEAVEPPIPEVEHLFIQLGRAHELTNGLGNAREAYEALLALGRELEEASLQVLSLNHLASLEFSQRETDLSKARALIEEARRVAGGAGLTAALVEIECNLADVMAIGADDYHEQSSAFARKTLASARNLEGRPDLVARALLSLVRTELRVGRFEESANYAEECVALSRELDQHPPQRTLFPLTGLWTPRFEVSWRAGARTMESTSLALLAYDRILQGRHGEGIRIAREALGMSRELPERIEAIGSWALSIGLVEIGEYEEGLALGRRGVEMAREITSVVMLWRNLDNLGRAYEALMDLEKAREVFEEALRLTRPLGRHYEMSSYIQLCAVAALSEDWEEAYDHARRAKEVGVFFNPVGIYLHVVIEALLRGGDEGLAREEVRRFAERAEANERNRIDYLHSAAILSEWDSDTQRAIEHLHEAHTLAGKLGLPGKLWQIQSRIGELHERRGEDEQAREAYSGAAQTISTLARKIEDEDLREGFLAAPRVRRMLDRV